MPEQPLSRISAYRLTYGAGRRRRLPFARVALRRVGMGSRAWSLRITHRDGSYSISTASSVLEVVLSECGYYKVRQ